MVVVGEQDEDAKQGCRASDLNSPRVQAVLISRHVAAQGFLSNFLHQNTKEWYYTLQYILQVRAHLHVLAERILWWQSVRTRHS